MTPERDYILAILAGAGVPSRTMLQKLVYLLGALQHEPVAYAAHFYGPYSVAVQEEIERLVAAELIEERMRVYETWQESDFDVIGYEYELTERGREAAAALPEPLRRTADRLVRTVKETGAWNQAALSMAAKLHHLQSIEPDLRDDAVTALADQFGWRMTTENARLGEALLRKLQIAPA